MKILAKFMAQRLIHLMYESIFSLLTSSQLSARLVSDFCHYLYFHYLSSLSTSLSKRTVILPDGPMNVLPDPVINDKVHLIFVCSMIFVIFAVHANTWRKSLQRKKLDKENSKLLYTRNQATKFLLRWILKLLVVARKRSLKRQLWFEKKRR